MTAASVSNNSMETAADATLSEDDKVILTAAEIVISAGLTTFLDVGEALATIRDSRLYREAHPTFESYCVERWKLGRNYVNKLITATQMTTTIAEAVGTAVPIPTTERQVRELAPLRDVADRLVPAWKDAVDRAGGAQPTAADVRAAVSAVRSAPAVRRRRPLPDEFRTAIWELQKAAERLERLVDDNRFPTHAADLTTAMDANLRHVFGVLGTVASRLRTAAP